MVELSDIEAVASRIATLFQPERIILFGSCAHGPARPDSDVDLLVVLPFEGKAWRMASEIRRRVRPPFTVDLLVRTPQELNERLGMRDWFIRDIVREGRVLYEA